MSGSSASRERQPLVERRKQKQQKPQTQSLNKTCLSETTVILLVVGGIVLSMVAFALSLFAFLREVLLEEIAALACVTASGVLLGILLLTLIVYVVGIRQRRRHFDHLRQSRWTKHLFEHTNATFHINEETSVVSNPPSLENNRHGHDKTSVSEQIQLVRKTNTIMYSLHQALAEGDDTAVLKLLKQINEIDSISEELLTKTGIGRLMNGIQGKYRRHAQAVVKKWRTDLQRNNTHQDQSSSDNFTTQSNPPSIHISGNSTTDMDLTEADTAVLRKLNSRLLKAIRDRNTEVINRALNKLEAGAVLLTPAHLESSELDHSN
eukprot:gene10893-2968_t